MFGLRLGCASVVFGLCLGCVWFDSVRFGSVWQSRVGLGWVGLEWVIYILLVVAVVVAVGSR